MNNKTLKYRLKDNRYVLLSAGLAALIFLITWIVRGIYPFGPRSILRVDLFHQYAPFLEEMRSRILTGKSLIYSWESGLGKDFISQMAYYTTSPLNIFIFLFPQKMISEAVAIFILIKISFCAGTFSYFIKRHFQRNDLSVTIFGLLYAFCAFITCYYWNIMWMDTVVLFPVVVLGLEKLIEEKKVLTYYIALTLTMIVNFYLAVLVSILISVYFIIYAFSKNTWKTDADKIISAFIRFVLVSVLCALSAMIILAPVAVALRQTEVSGQTLPSFEIYPGIWQLVSAHFLGARAAVLARNEDMPNIYTGVLTVMLLPVYFTDRKIRKREKILFSAFLGFMLLSSCIKPLDFIIHGMHFPANLPHRFTFVYSFILLCMAYRGFMHLQNCKVKWIALTFAGYIAALLLYEFVILRFVDDIDRVLTNSDLGLNIAAMCIYLLLMWLVCGEKNSKKALPAFFLPALLLCVFAECQFSMITNLDDMGNRDEYVRYMDDTKKAVRYMNDIEGLNFYRTEFRRFTTINDGALYHYNGFSQFSSLAPGGTSALTGNLGIASTGNSFRYYDPTPLIDALFDVKYVMTKDEEYPKADKYTLDNMTGSIRIYRNERVLPLAFGVDSDITNWQTTDSWPFDVQNDFGKKAASVSDPMFTMLPEEKVTFENIEITEKTGPNDFSYKLTDPSSLEKQPTVHVEYTAPEDAYVYLYVDAGNASRFIYANYTVKEDRELSAGKSLIDVGHVVKGEPIVCDFALTKRGEFEKVYRPEGDVRICCAMYSDEAFNKVYDRLVKEPYTITSFRDTKIEGTVTMEKDGVLFSSIPFTAGWSVTVDGKKAEKMDIGGGLIGTALSAGDHTVVFSYTPPFFIPAVIISLAGVALFIFYYRRHKKDETGSVLLCPPDASDDDNALKHDRFHRQMKADQKNDTHVRKRT